MPIKKIALFTIIFIIPSFVYFIMCPFAHSFTASKSQQLIVMQQLQQNNLQHKEHTAVPLGHSSFFPFNLQDYDKTIAHFLQPSFDQELTNRLTMLKTTRLNI
jgi:hypothetical protein